MAESELFGHEKGAFTGAHARKRGLLELAEGGTLLLDEIGELPPGQQSKLLTFLDTHMFTRVGGEKQIKVNARLIAATNRDLEEEKNSGRFREDLFYRLNVFQIRVPALRERMEDIPALIIQLALDNKLSSLPEIDTEAMEELRRYSWPGNVRELRNVLEGAIILSRGTAITVDEIHLRSEKIEGLHDDIPIGPALRPLSHLSDKELKQMYEEVCVRLIEEKGERLGEPGSPKAIATVLERARETVSRELKRLGCAKVEPGAPSKGSMNDLTRRLETWLARHSFDHGRASR